MTADEAARSGDRDLVIAFDGHKAGKGLREIAEDLYGVETVAAEWGPDSGLRRRTRRLLRTVQNEAGRG